MKDTQAEVDRRGKIINKVGVRKINCLINHGTYREWAEVSAYVALPDFQRGVHMSRFVEVFEASTNIKLDQMTTLLTHYLDKLCSVHEAKEAFVKFRLHYPYTQVAPESNRVSTRKIPLILEGEKRGDTYTFYFTVILYVTSLCPCCFLSDTPIYLSNDVMFIKCVEEESKTLENSFVEKTFKYPSKGKSYVRVKAAGTLPVSCTSDHEFFVRDIKATSDEMKWKEAKHLCAEDYLCIPRIETQAKDFQFIDTTPYSNPSQFKTRPPKPVADKIIIDEDVGRFLGLCIAEGGLTSKGHTYALSFNKKEQHLIDFTVHILSSRFKAAPKTYPSKVQNSVSVAVTRVVLARVFKDMFYTDEGILRVPKLIMNSPPEVIKQFLIGWYEGDGSHTVYRIIQRIICTSKLAALQAQLLSVLLGFFISITVTKAENSKAVTKRGTKAIIKDQYNIILNKYSLYKLGLSDPPKVVNNKIRQDDDYIYVPVTSVEKIPCGVSSVYDLQTNKSRYTIPYLVHNSKEISNHGAHNQRTIVETRCHLQQDIDFSEFLDCINLGSAPIIELLKRPDEKAVTEEAYENAKFCEDIARDVSVAIDKFDGVGNYSLVVESEESIHDHTALAIIDHFKFE